ncbi:PhzF family phenazine biosynthesis protein [Clostridium aminobutyricum]|uniref:PhzF family phenazine biosynthesis protein n=1 Tax=Clostridium aminobutyricum TaxID=33953 RepID=A0A939IIF4_CLOAM|nr:PhzF family phenazine biosynthesis protein [Clostridium aminobutyricum]MBN7773021.1 PhzF family phenazine biosynthesis protein [Clostridium aminobutyricum]
MKFQIVDAFSDKLFGGNPAGVVLIDNGQEFPLDVTMQKTAAELRYSETAFVKKMNENEFTIRYFTPASEVELCGHATIGSFGALLETGVVRDGSSYILHTLAGTLQVEIKDGLIWMDMALPQVVNTLSRSEQRQELANVMGIHEDDLYLEPQIVSTGLPDILMGVRSLAVLNNIQPDFPALSKLSEQYGVTGVHAFSLGTDKVTANCRNFAPLYAIDEEAATGTSNGALTFYLYQQGFIKEEQENLFIQGESMGRPSKIMSRLQTVNEIVKIQVGGVYKRLAQGEIYI